MDLKFSFSLLSFIICSLAPEKGSAILCYVCNSYFNGSECSELGHQSEKTKNMYATDCKFHQGPKPAKACRKMYQDFSDQGGIRVIRQCAVRWKAGCKEKSTGKRSGLSFVYCHCTEPLCNSSRRNRPSLSTHFSVLPFFFLLLK